MKIKTTRFGEIEIEEGKIITFPAGIPGFQNEKRYVLLPAGDDSPLIWLQSVENPALAFLAASPADFGLNYSFDLSDTIAEELEIQAPDDLLILVLLTLRREEEGRDGQVKVTANLLGPLVINANKKKGRQVVLDPSKYPVQYDMSAFFKKSAGGPDKGRQAASP